MEPVSSIPAGSEFRFKSVNPGERVSADATYTFESITYWVDLVSISYFNDRGYQVDLYDFDRIELIPKAV